MHSLEEGAHGSKEALVPQEHGSHLTLHGEEKRGKNRAEYATHIISQAGHQQEQSQ